MGSPNKDAIHVDHAAAQTYWTAYLATLLGEMHARGLILTHAMDKYNEFVNLPPGDKRAGNIWALAWEFLKVAVPALRLDAFVTGLHNSAAMSVAMATLTARSAEKAKRVQQITRALHVAGGTAKKIDDGLETAGKVVDAARNLGKELLGMNGSNGSSTQPDNPVSKLDVARPGIHDLIQQSRNAIEGWKKAGNALQLKYKNRVMGIETDLSESLEAHIQKVLPPVPVMTEKELEQLEMLYLWKMVAGYCKQYVKFVEVTTEHHIHGATELRVQKFKSMRLDGLNDTQKQRILDWFAKGVFHGTKVYSPPIPDVNTFLGLIAIPHASETKYHVVYTPSAKM